MAATTLDLPDIEKGSTYRHTLYWTDKAKNPINLSSTTARMQVREAVDSAGFLLDLTSSNGGITIGAFEGKLALFISASATANLLGSGGVYDLEVQFSNGDVVRLIQGEVSFSPEVTR
jgi:hypothetical protein